MKMTLSWSFFILLIQIFTLVLQIQCNILQFPEHNVIDEDNVAKKHNLKFTTTFESFLPLVDREYRIKARREQDFQENISLSMYRYYMTQHLYARLAQVRVTKGLANRIEHKFANHVQSITPSVPYGILTYFNSIGDIESPKGENSTHYFFEYSFITWPNNEGHFGRIDSNTHWMYMSFPAPEIIAQAVQEDLFYSSGLRDSHWNLKPHIAPRTEESYPGLPTANLLGWKQSITLTLLQRQNLQLCGIDEINFENTNPQFQFNSKLMEIVHEYFHASSQAIVNIKTWYKNKAQNLGTHEQLAWLEREFNDNAPFSRTFAFLDKDVLVMIHPLQRGSVYLNKLSLIMPFRVRKYATATNDWAIYDWQIYERVPESWIKTRNTVFEFGDIDGSTGTGISFSDQRDGIRMEFLDRCYKGQPMYQ